MIDCQLIMNYNAYLYAVPLPRWRESEQRSDEWVLESYDTAKIAPKCESHEGT